MRSIIESTLVGLIVVSLDGKVRIANPSAIDMFGYDWQELTERHFVTLFGEGRAAADDYDIEKCWQMILDKSIDHLCEVEAFRKSGEGFPVQLSLNEFQAAEGTCYLANILDISELRELERRRREFVATVTHELRTPLTSIYGSMSLLLTDPNLAPKNKEMIAIAERSCSRLIKLINDLLDVEKLDTGMLLLELDVVGIATVVKRSVEAVEVLAEKSKIEIRTEIEELDVVADEDRLVQVLVNLLSNAIKFSPAGETVSVRAFKVNRDKVAGSAASAGAGTSHTDGNSRPDSPASNLVEIQVIDKGRGIPESARKLLFHRFQQVEAGDAKEKGGTGLGLAICKAIITQHDGGSIGVDSEEGKGSTFWFRLPSA